MIAGGSAALNWERPVLLEVLIGVLHQRIQEAAGRGPGRQPRLAAVTAVIGAALHREHYASLTLRELIQMSAPRCLRLDDTPTHLLHFVEAGVAYLGEGGAEPLLAALHTHSASDDQRAALETWGTAWAKGRRSVAMAAALERRKRAVQPFWPTSRSSEEHTFEWSAEAARGALLVYLGDGPPRFSAAAPPSPAEVDALGHLMELYGHFQLQDPVAHDHLERAALGVWAASPAMIHRLAPAAHRSPRLFARVRAALADATGNPAEPAAECRGGDVTPLGAVQQAYRDVLDGRRVPAELLFRVTEEFHSGDAEAVARTACVFAEGHSIPANVIAALSGEALRLSAGGTAALLRAAWRDPTGSLFGPAAVAMRRVDVDLLHAASTPELEDLLRALALPRPRHSNLPAPLLAALRVLETTVMNYLRGVARSESLHESLRLLSVHGGALGKGEGEGEKELLSLVCERAVRRADLSAEESMACLRLLTRHAYVHEPLLDRLASVMGRLLEAHFREPSDEGQGLPVVLEWAFLQSRGDFPEFEGLAREVVHRVEHARIASPLPEHYLAAGLLSLRDHRPGALLALQAGLVGVGRARGWRAETLPYAAHLLWQAPCVDLALLREVVEAVAHQIAEHASGGRPYPYAEEVGRLVAVHARCYSMESGGGGGGAAVLPATVLAYAEEHIAACGPEVYTSLCRCAYQGGVGVSFCDALITALPGMLDALAPRQIGESLCGLGELAHAGQRLSHQLASEKASDYVVDNVELFWSGPGIARLLKGLARLHCTKRNLYNVFARQLSRRPVLATLDRESIALALSAFGTAKYLDKRLFDRLSQVCVRHAEHLSTADVLLTVKAHSRVMLLNEEYYERMGHEIVRRAEEFPFNAQCDLLHAYGAVEVANDAVAHRLLECIAARVDEFADANAATAILASLARMNFGLAGDEQVEQVAGYVADHAESLSNESVHELCAILGSGSWNHTALLRSVAEHSVQLRKEDRLTAEVSRAVLDTLGRHMLHHPQARTQLSQLAKTASKEVALLSEEESEQLQQLLSR